MYKLNVNVNGNKKLINNAETRFIIWNLPAIKTCPYATEHCKKACYALKAERIYPQVKPSREKNLEEAKKPEFAENMIYTIDKLLNSKAYQGKKVIFRIHESGDFFNQAYFNAWVNIAKHFEHENIVFLAYTKSLKFVVSGGYGKKDFPENMVIRSSIWDDTKPENIELTKLYNIPVYTALTADEMSKETNFTKCNCKDCANCQDCVNKSKKRIICEIH